jgi:hypothetical protein
MSVAKFSMAGNNLIIPGQGEYDNIIPWSVSFAPFPLSQMQNVAV